MGTFKADNDDVILDAGAGQGTKFKVDGTEVASVSSTGAFTSTTIDATKLTGTLPAIDGSALTNLPGGGKVLQVVSSEFNTSFVTTSGSYVDTPVTLSITPTATTSKILVMVTAPLVTYNQSGADAITQYRLYGATNSELVNGYQRHYDYDNNGGVTRGEETMMHLDSPTTIASENYKVQIAKIAGTQSRICDGSVSATVTLIEIDGS